MGLTLIYPRGLLGRAKRPQQIEARDMPPDAPGAEESKATIRGKMNLRGPWAEGLGGERLPSRVLVAPTKP